MVRCLDVLCWNTPRAGLSLGLTGMAAVETDPEKLTSDPPSQELRGMCWVVTHYLHLVRWKARGCSSQHSKEGPDRSKTARGMAKRAPRRNWREIRPSAAVAGRRALTGT